MDWSRLDGRPCSSHRPIKFELNPLKTGPSCKIELGNFKDESGNLSGVGDRTSVISLLLFTTEQKSKNAVGSFHKPNFEVFIRPSSGVIKSSIRSLEGVLLKAMQRLVCVEKFGKITLSFRLQIIEDSGGLLSVCLNSLILCLSISGIGLKSTPYSLSFGIVSRSENDNFVILDPSLQEIKSYCSTSLTVLCEPESGNLTLTNIDSGSGMYGDCMDFIKNLAKIASNKCLQLFEQAKQQSLNNYRITFEAMS